MGRTLNQKYFGNMNAPNVVGGEGIAKVGIILPGMGYNAESTWTASNPQLEGGTVASGTVVVNDSGIPTEFVIKDAGSGYTSTASVTISVIPRPATTGTIAVRLTEERDNALAFYAWVPFTPDGEFNVDGTAIPGGDITKQKGTNRFTVKNSQGYGTCFLVDTPASFGEMNIAARDWYGNYYFVSKIESKKVRLTRNVNYNNSPWVYNTGDLAKWAFTAATGTDKTLVTTCVQVASV